jgi:hypothetical protein
MPTGQIQSPSGAVQQLQQLQAQAGSADWSRWTQNRWCFYDYVELNPLGDSKLQFFNIPIGQPDPNIPTIVKTYEQTNMQEVRSFGRINFLLKQIRTHIRILPKVRQVAGIGSLPNSVYFDYTALTSYLADFQEQGVLLITIGQKEYMDIPQPFKTCPPGFGLCIDQHSANSGAMANQASWFQQSPLASDVYNVQPEQLIEAGQTFNVTITFDNANYAALTNLMTGGTLTPKVEIGLIFDGFVLRPVQ